MEQRRLLLAYSPLVIFWAIDFFTKTLMMDDPSFQFHLGALNIVYHENHGMIMGSFNKLPSMLRVVLLSTVGVSIVAIYPLIMSLINFRSSKVIVGLSLLFSGILGNVIDRIIYGFVLDMIYFQTTWFTTPVFNVADLSQLMAYVLIAYGSKEELSHQLPEKNRRSLKWVNPKFQYQFCFSLLGITFFATTVSLVFGLTFLKQVLSEYVETAVAKELLDSFFITALAIQLVTCLSIFAIGKVISFRIAGPVVGIKRYLEDILEGRYYIFKLREGDNFKELERPLTVLGQRLSKYEREMNRPD